MFFCNYLRRRALRRSLSKIPTSIIPITDIHSATVLLDASEPGFEDCAATVREYFRSRSVQVKMIYLYLSRLEKGAESPVDGASALLHQDLDWCGRPSESKISAIAGSETDLFVSLCRKSYPAEFISSCIPAHFKVGCFSLPVYDVVLDGREEQSQKEVFRSIEDLFTKIK